jgi:competence protein ComEA
VTRISFACAVTLVLTPLLLGRTTAVAQAPEQQELPDAAGKKILVASCTSCHELTEVTKFRGYYTRADWNDIVVTMVKYGATVKEQDVPVLVDYLYSTLGKKN